MRNNTPIALGEHYAAFVAEQVASGRYVNASEVVRAGLRLLEEHELKLKELREADAPKPVTRDEVREKLLGEKAAGEGDGTT